MTHVVFRRMFAALFIMSLATGAGAQGVTASLSGTAVDTAGGLIPGANVTVTNKASGTTFTAVTNASGEFAVPALDAGTYVVNVALMGFKTAIVEDVRLQPGIPTSVKAVLEVGRLEETVLVQGGAQLV